MNEGKLYLYILICTLNTIRNGVGVQFVCSIVYVQISSHFFPVVVDIFLWLVMMMSISSVHVENINNIQLSSKPYLMHVICAWWFQMWFHHKSINQPSATIIYYPFMFLYLYEISHTTIIVYYLSKIVIS